MWSAKFKLSDKNNPIVQLVKETKTIIYYYPLNHYTKDKKHYFLATGIVEGEYQDKFFKELKKIKNNRNVENLEINSNSFIILTSAKVANKYIDLFYNPAIIHLKPAIIYPDGFEEQEIVSFDRSVIENIVKVGKELYGLKLSYLKQKKVKNIGVFNILPDLTEKQKEAVTLAMKEGYYTYPRGADVQDLAKMKKLSFSTFQEHLRRAENKLMPFSVKKL
ncbi:helix-turn-helix domain-containing protein [Nanoarchaeota archaeon]